MGVSIASDGSEDDQIAVFKEGRDCEIGIPILKEWRETDDQELEEEKAQGMETIFEEGSDDAEILFETAVDEEASSDTTSSTEDLE